MNKSSKNARIVVSLLLTLLLAFPVFFAGASNIGASYAADGPNMTILSAEVTESNAANFYKYRTAIKDSADKFLVGQGDMYLKDGKYYTYFREASLAEQRTFVFESKFSKGTAFAGGIGTGADQFDIGKAELWFGVGSDTVAGTYNRALLDWTGTQMQASGSNVATLIGTPTAVDSGDTITVTAEVRFNNLLGTSSSGLSLARATFLNDMRTATLRLHYDGIAESLASMPFKVNARDYLNTWQDVDVFCRETGPHADEFILADGTVVPSDGTYGAPTRYVRIESLGKSSGITPSGSFARHEPNDLWMGMVADSPESVDRYLNEIEPMLETDPAAIYDRFDKKDLRLPIVYTNIHSGEAHGMDAVVNLFKLIAEGDVVQYERANEIAHNSSSGGYNQMNVDKGTTTIKMDIDKDLLSGYIFIFIFCQNPDGRMNGGTRAVNYGFDPNRDGSYHEIQESVIQKGFMAAWDPIMVLEFHNSANPIQFDPCTAPHDPNSEYDLLTPRLHEHANEMGAAITGTTVFPRYQICDEHAGNGVGFDDASPIYSPNFTMHYGGINGTIESQGGAALDVIGNMIASFGTMHNFVKNHDDFWDFKIEYKRRGVENENTDAKVNPYLFSASPNVGMPWKTLSGAVPWTWGESLSAAQQRVGTPMMPRNYSMLPGGSFFPQYYAIPMDSAVQLDVSQAYNMLTYLTRAQVRVERLTSDVTTDGVTYKAGTLIVDLAQGNRDIANTVLCEGVDFSDSPRSLYAEVVQSFPGTRGFSCYRVEEKGAFAGKTEAINYTVTEFGKKMKNENELTKISSVITGNGSTVVVKNNGLDAVKMVIKALQDGNAVNMLTYNLPGTGIRGDFVMSKAVFDAYKDAFYIEGKTVASLDSKYYQELVRPLVQVNGSMGENTLSFEKLGFTVGDDLVYGTLTNRNVVINFNSNTNVTNLLEQGVGLINIGSTGADFAGNAMGTGYAGGALTTTSSAEAVLKAAFASNSIITANMELAKYVYTQRVTNVYAIRALPESAVALVTAGNDNHIDPAIRYKNAYNPDSFFVSGWAYAAGDGGQVKSQYADKIFAASGTYQGAPDGAPIVTITPNVMIKAHNELFAQRILGNSILTVAAGINPNAAPGNTVLANIAVDEESDIDQDVCFTLSLSGADKVLTVDAEFTVDGSMLAGKGIEPLNGFRLVDGIAYSYMGGDMWKGKATLAYPAGDSEGFTYDGTIDIAKIVFAPRAVGDTTVTLTDVLISGFDAEGKITFYHDGVIGAGVATTNIDQRVFSKYDLNRDNKVDALDLGVMLLYCGFGKDTPGWNSLVKVNDSRGKPVTASMCDVNSDGIIDMLDLLDLFIHYTK
ncbi:MAG: dockerin type I domain-containing protein [Clostridiales bacterium]|nr:dockerin type I domain-containing protein [Clostridiales bacterium]